LEGDTHITKDLGILLLFVSLYPKIGFVYFIYIYFVFVSETKNSLNDIENCSPAKSARRDGQGKSDKQL